jgi:hypothetical protein
MTSRTEIERQIIPAGEPPSELVEYHIEREFNQQLALFGDNVEMARMIFRHYPEFVTAAEFPAQLRAAFIAYYQYEPEDSFGLIDQALKPGYRESLREQAHEIAKAWMDNGVTVEALAKLGLVEESEKLRQLRISNEVIPGAVPEPDRKVMELLSMQVGVSMVRMFEGLPCCLLGIVVNKSIVGSE